jgi:tetratricopeptide (TPR) repeat protein
MTFPRLVTTTLSAMLIVLIGPAGVSALPEDQPQLYKAYYLEQQEQEYAAARKLYDRLASADAPGEVKRAAQAGANRCRDYLAAENFATLMPADSVAYFELKRPGRIIEQFAEMLGLAGKDVQEFLAKRPNGEANIQIDPHAPPFHLPEEIFISPAIFEFLNGFGGVAVALTDFDTNGGPPSGIMVLHHGDTALLRGLMETAFQFSPTTEKVAGMPTFGFRVPEVGNVTGVLTESLLIVGTGRDLVEGAVKRLTGVDPSSLATREDLEEVVGQRGDATLFTFVNLQAVLKIVKANMSGPDQKEFAVANALCDLDSLRWATFSAGIDDGALGLQLAVRFADDHRSIAYNMLRLPPMTRKCLGHVPPNAAAFFALGLNPALAGAVANAAKNSKGEPAVTGFDIGREFFGNIQEICAFVIPGKMSKPEGDGGPDIIPNVGVVLAVNDLARSRALWNQLLSLPGLIAGDEPITPQTVKIGKTEATAFAIPKFGKVYLAELDGCLAFGATRSAIKAAIRAHNKKKSILDDEVMGGIIADMPEHSSVMAVAHVGRLAQVACGLGDPGLAMGAAQAADLCDEMVAWFGLGQSPSQLTLQAAVRGLPQVNEALKKFGPMIQTMAAMMPSRKSDTSESDTSKSEVSEADVNELTGKVISAARSGNLEQALKYALQARELADTGRTNYNVACVYSLLEKHDKAFEYLFPAVEQGIERTDTAKKMEGDGDLDNIRHDPRYAQALAIAKGGPSKPKKTPKPAKSDEVEL